MIRLAVKLALAGAALWAIWTFVPVRERTLAERWRAAGSVSAFLERGLAELTGAGEPRPARPQARAQKPAGSRERPSEGHTDADRDAVERLLSERLSK
jgi:hypothetical protein